MPRLESLDPDVQVNWKPDQAAIRIVNGGVVSRTWPFEAVIDAGRQPGARIAMLRVFLDDLPSDLVLRWNVESAIQLEPQRVVMRRATGDSQRQSIRVSAVDSSLFGLTAVRSSHAAIRAVWDSQARSASHEVEVVVEPVSTEHVAIAWLQFETDRLDQPSVRLPVFLFPATTNEVGVEDSP